LICNAAHKDDLTPNGYLIDKILDKTGMKGTGKDSFHS
jgi:6-phosphogluconate dehydrogenase